MRRILVLVTWVFCSMVIIGCYRESSPSPETTLQALALLIGDRDASVRRTAADAIGKIGDRSAEPVLIGALLDADSSVREAAARGLGRLPELGKEAARALSFRLEDPHRAVRRTAAQAMAEAEGIPLLSVARLLGSPDSELRQTAAYALSLVEVREPSVIGALVIGARDVDQDVRQWSVAALGESGDARALPVLMDRLAHDPAENVRGEAAYRLRFVGTESTVGELDVIAAGEPSGIVREWIQDSRTRLKKESGSGSAPRPAQLTGPALSHRFP